jgi:hypothetical protein
MNERDAEQAETRMVSRAGDPAREGAGVTGAGALESEKPRRT